MSWLNECVCVLPLPSAPDEPEKFGRSTVWLCADSVPELAAEDAPELAAEEAPELAAEEAPDVPLTAWV